jgi:hypothetical protein
MCRFFMTAGTRLDRERTLDRVCPGAQLFLGGNVMQKKTIVCMLMTMVFVCSGWLASAQAREVRTYDELYKLLPGQGTVDQAPEIDRALKTVIKLQELREQRLVTIDNPKDIQVFNPRFLSIGFDASIRRPGSSAKAKPTPAVYALLFEKSDANALTFYKSIFLVWAGDQDVAAYKSVSPDKMTEYFRSKGAEYVYLEKEKKVESAKQEELVISGAQIKGGVVAEAFIDPAITRDSELQSILTNYALKSAETTKAAAPEDSQRIQQLEARIKRLEALLANVTRNGNELVFAGMNVHIQNGTGSVSKINGTGNLVVGYDDPGAGSHNVLVGAKNTCNSYGGLVTGVGHTVTKKYGAITGGSNNEATGDYAVIVGGHDNKSSGDFSSILGGHTNKAQGNYSSINGQQERTKVGEGDNKHFRKE